MEHDVHPLHGAAHGVAIPDVPALGVDAQRAQLGRVGAAEAAHLVAAFEEDARDRLGEAEEVMAFAGIGPGMSVADIGAGEGYYTVRLSPMVGRSGRVLAQDIVPATRDQLARRVDREGLDNVSVRLGLADEETFDRVVRPERMIGR